MMIMCDKCDINSFRFLKNFLCIIYLLNNYNTALSFEVSYTYTPYFLFLYSQRKVISKISLMQKLLHSLKLIG